MQEQPPHYMSLYTRRVWIAAMIAAFTLTLLMVVWYGIHALLLLFAALLAALAFSIPTRGLTCYTPLSRGWALAMVLLLMIGGGGGFFYWGATRLILEGEQLVQALPDGFDAFRDQLAHWPLLPGLLDELQSELSGSDSLFSNWMARATSFVTSTTGMLLNIALIGIIGFYIAAEPGLYRRGLLALAPPTRRAGMETLIDVLVTRLSWWLLGQLISMSVVGLLTWVGLWLLGVPSAFTLAALAGLLQLIPNLGPIASALPAILIAFGESPDTAFWVLGLYCVVQVLESYAITPLVQRRAVKLPPGLLMIVQVGLGTWAGLIGLVVAAPMTAAAIVMIDQCYVKGWLGQQRPAPRD